MNTSLKLTLKAWQESLQQALVSHIPPELNDVICSTEHLSVAARIDIYRISMQESLKKALRSTYPVCVKLVGNDFFNAMALLYVKQNPSTSPSIKSYGATFPDFIRHFEPAKSLAYLADVALLEWYFEDASQGQDHVGLDVMALSKVPEADYPYLRFHLASNSHLLASNYPIHRIWQMNQDEYQGDESVNLDQGGVKLLIWRQQMNMRMDIVSEVQWICLNNIVQGKKLADLGDDTTVHVLEDFMKRGWLVDFEVCQK